MTPSTLMIGRPRAHLLRSAVPCTINTPIVAHAFGLMAVAAVALAS